MVQAINDFIKLEKEIIDWEVMLSIINFAEEPIVSQVVELNIIDFIQLSINRLLMKVVGLDLYAIDQAWGKPIASQDCLDHLDLHSSNCSAHFSYTQKVSLEWV